MLERRGNAIAWWLADALAFGELRFRREYGPALERMYARSSLRNLASVSRRVAPERRREDLSFSHHADVASLPPDRQTHWLDAAAREDWSCAELRERLRAERGGGRGGAALTIRAVANLRDLCLQAAERVGLEPAEWATRTLEQAARRELADAAGEASLERAALNRAAELVA